MKVSTIFIIEDDEILRDSYEYYINSFENYRTIGSFTSVENALKEFNDLRPDIIISDISLTGMSGVDGITKFKSLDKKVKILMISIHSELEYISNSFKNLADGYLTKPIDKPSFLSALNNLDNNIVPLSKVVSRKMVDLVQHSTKISFLTDRENEIVSLLTQGYTYKRIGEKLYITASTVNFHIQNIYFKLNVKSKSEALVKIKELTH